MPEPTPILTRLAGCGLFPLPASAIRRLGLSSPGPETQAERILSVVVS